MKYQNRFSSILSMKLISCLIFFLLSQGILMGKPNPLNETIAACNVYTFTNNTGNTASDLHVTFTGTGGSLDVMVTGNPPGCPPPGIPSNGTVTNTMIVDWGIDCVQNGQSVTVKVSTENGPLEVNGGFWSGVDNQESPGVGILNPEDIAVNEGSGCTDSFACNYDPTAIEDDGSCFYPNPEEAIVDVISALESAPDTQDAVAYFYQQPLLPGDVVQSPDADGVNITVESLQFLVWVDLESEALFGHKTQFIMVDPCNGGFEVYDDLWWPVVNGVEIWSTSLERSSPSNVIFGIPTEEPVEVILNEDTGVQGGDDSYENVCVLIVSGVDTTANKWAKADVENVDKSLCRYFGEDNIDKKKIQNNPTYKQLCDTMAAMAESEGKDKFVFYFTGHATKKYLALRAHPWGSDDRELTPAELKEKLEAFDVPVWIMINACNAKDHADGLESGDINGHVMYSSKNCTPTVTNSVRGTYWTTYFTECLNNSSADSDDEGTDVSPKEASDWAEKALDDSGRANQGAQDSGMIPLEEQEPLCYTYVFTNNTGNVASDLHVTFTGTGGSLNTVVTVNPPGCPVPAVPSNGNVTNTMVVDWGVNCVQNGQSVTVKVSTENGPLEIDSGFWTGVGNQEFPGVGELNAEDYSEVEPSGGCTDQQGCNYDPTATFDDGTCILPDFEQFLSNVVTPYLEGLPEAERAVAYLYPQPLHAGDVVRDADVNGLDVTIQSTQYLIWVDTDPEATFSHPTHFLTGNPCSELLVSHNSQWWPEINGTEIWSNSNERSSLSNVIFGTPQEEPVDIVLNEDTEFQGGDNSYENVCVLIVSGVDTTTNKWAKADVENVDRSLCRYFGEDNIDKKTIQNNPTYQQLCDTIAAMAESTDKDKFVFYFTGHAAKTYLALRAHPRGNDDRELTPAKLKAKLEAFNVPVWVMLFACNAEDNANGLEGDIDGHVLYSSKSCTPSIYNTARGSYWTTYLTECLNNPSADGDDEGTDISPQEAADWAEAALNDSGRQNQQDQDSGILELANEEPLCYTYVITNNTGNAASDLHVTFTGTGGSLGVTVTANPPGCPVPTTPSNGTVTNTAVVDWGVNCVQNGQSVTIKVTTDNGPLEFDSGFWTGVGNQEFPGVGEVGADDIVLVESKFGCTYPGAINYDLFATIDDGSCTFCVGDFNGDFSITVSDLTGFLGVFGSNCE